MANLLPLAVLRHRAASEPNRRFALDLATDETRQGFSSMPSVAISELIKMYSSGVISRDNLEREISLWSPDEPRRREREVMNSDDDGYITLYPDQSGTWRVAA